MKGVGPDEPTVQNKTGGKQSKLEYRFDLLPAQALAQIAEILYHGAIKYGENNWRSIPSRDHLNRAITHSYAHLSGDTQDDHPGHAACRMLMFLEMYIREQQEPPANMFRVKTKTCPTCKGDGVGDMKHRSVIDDTLRCSMCKGIGMISEEINAKNDP